MRRARAHKPGTSYPAGRCPECGPLYPQDQESYMVERRVVAILRTGSLRREDLEREVLRLWGAEQAAIVGGALIGDQVDYTFAFWQGNEVRMQQTFHVRGEGLVFTLEQQAWQHEGSKRLRAHLAAQDAARRAAEPPPRIKRRKKVKC